MAILVAELAFQCLQQDKEMRPSMDEVLEALKTIQSGEDAREDQEMAYDDDGVLNVQKPALLDRYEVGLLNCKSLPPSPGAPPIIGLVGLLHLMSVFKFLLHAVNFSNR